MKRSYTIKDIAELAGVSKGTVDRVLHKRGKVSQIALDKVNSVLNEIDYQPNLIARNLKNTKVYRICVLLPDPTNDLYWEPCIEGIKEAVEEFKSFNISVETFLFNPFSTKSYIEANLAVLDSSPDAVLLVPLFQKETLEIVEKYNSAGVLVNTFNNQVASDFIKGFVGQDLLQSGRVAAKLLDLLLNKGDIVIIHIDEDYKNAVFMQEKEKGFRNYFEELKNSNYNILTCKLKHPHFEKDLTLFLDEHPSISGIFVTTSKGYQVAQITSKMKNKNIATVGYDLLKENLEFLNKNAINFLIHQNPKRQAYLGTASLIEYFIFDKEIPTEKYLPIDIINTENAKNYIA